MRIVCFCRVLDVGCSDVSHVCGEMSSVQCRHECVSSGGVVFLAGRCGSSNACVSLYRCGSSNACVSLYGVEMIVLL